MPPGAIVSWYSRVPSSPSVASASDASPPRITSRLDSIGSGSSSAAAAAAAAAARAADAVAPPGLPVAAGVDGGGSATTPAGATGAPVRALTSSSVAG